MFTKAKETNKRHISGIDLKTKKNYIKTSTNKKIKLKLLAQN